MMLMESFNIFNLIYDIIGQARDRHLPRLLCKNIEPNACYLEMRIALQKVNYENSRSRYEKRLHTWVQGLMKIVYSSAGATGNDLTKPPFSISSGQQFLKP